MNTGLDFVFNKAAAGDIAKHLAACDRAFVPPLSERLSIDDYAQKLAGKAAKFEAWAGGSLVGLVAAYCNDQETRVAYISNVSVLPTWTLQGIAGQLLDHCVKHAQKCGMRQVSLEVAAANTAAIRLYVQAGFTPRPEQNASIIMDLIFTGEK